METITDTIRNWRAWIARNPDAGKKLADAYGEGRFNSEFDRLFALAQSPENSSAAVWDRAIGQFNARRGLN